MAAFEIRVPGGLYTWDMPFYTTNWTTMLTGGTSAFTPTPTPPTPTQRLIGDIRALPGDELPAVKAAIEKAEKERKDRIAKALQASCDLDIIAGTKGRRFQVAYWSDGEICKTEGVEYPVERDEDGDIIGYSVLVDDHEHDFDGYYETVKEFRDYFESRDIPYSIAYFDK